MIEITSAGETVVGDTYRSYVHAFDSVAAERTPNELGALIDSLGTLAAAVSHADDDLFAEHGRQEIAGNR